MKRLIVTLALLSCAVYGQKTYSNGQVVKWQRQACGQFILPQKPIGGIEQPSITSTQYCNVYHIKIADLLFQIESRHKPSLENGQTVAFRLEKRKMFIRNERGKEDKFDIVGEESLADSTNAEK